LRTHYDGLIHGSLVADVGPVNHTMYKAKIIFCCSGLLHRRSVKTN